MQPGQDALRLLACGLVQSGEPLTAIKCLEAICRSPSLKPADNACARLQLAGLLMEYTRSLEQAALHLNHAVSSQSMLRCDESHDSDHLVGCLLPMQPAHNAIWQGAAWVTCLLSSRHEQVTMTHSVQVVLLSATPYMYCLKCEVLARLATCSRYLNDTKTQRTAHEKGLLTCEAGQQTAERCVQRRCRALVLLLGVFHRQDLQQSNGISAKVGRCCCPPGERPAWCHVAAVGTGLSWWVVSQSSHLCGSEPVCLQKVLLCLYRSTLQSAPGNTRKEE